MIEIKEGPLTLEMKAKIEEGFARHALDMTGMEGKGDLIAFMAYDVSKDGNPLFVGVVCAQLFWGQLHIKYVLVEPSYRKRGIASELMEKALSYGRIHKCTFAFVETMSFQAPEFYKKLGFTLEFSRHAFSKDASFHYLKRDL
jgi:ribosomal protein S18 acetylase RimI-like enzyme